MRRAGVEPTTSSARTSPRCLRGGPRRSLYTLTCTLTSSIFDLLYPNKEMEMFATFLS